MNRNTKHLDVSRVNPAELSAVKGIVEKKQSPDATATALVSFMFDNKLAGPDAYINRATAVFSPRTIENVTIAVLDKTAALVVKRCEQEGKSLPKSVLDYQKSEKVLNRRMNAILQTKSTDKEKGDAIFQQLVVNGEYTRELGLVFSKKQYSENNILPLMHVAVAEIGRAGTIPSEDIHKSVEQFVKMNIPMLDALTRVGKLESATVEQKKLGEEARLLLENIKEVNVEMPAWADRSSYPRLICSFDAELKNALTFSTLMDEFKAGTLQVRHEYWKGYPRDEYITYAMAASYSHIGDMSFNSDEKLSEKVLDHLKNNLKFIDKESNHEGFTPQNMQLWWKEFLARKPEGDLTTQQRYAIATTCNTLLEPAGKALEEKVRNYKGDEKDRTEIIAMGNAMREIFQQGWDLSQGKDIEKLPRWEVASDDPRQKLADVLRKIQLSALMEDKILFSIAEFNKDTSLQELQKQAFQLRNSLWAIGNNGDKDDVRETVVHTVGEKEHAINIAFRNARNNTDVSGFEIISNQPLTKGRVYTFAEDGRMYYSDEGRIGKKEQPFGAYGPELHEVPFPDREAIREELKVQLATLTRELRIDQVRTAKDATVVRKYHDEYQQFIKEEEKLDHNYNVRLRAAFETRNEALRSEMANTVETTTDFKVASSTLHQLLIADTTANLLNDQRERDPGQVFRSIVERGGDNLSKHLFDEPNTGEAFADKEDHFTNFLNEASQGRNFGIDKVGVWLENATESLIRVRSLEKRVAYETIENGRVSDIDLLVNDMLGKLLGEHDLPEDARGQTIHGKIDKIREIAKEKVEIGELFNLAQQVREKLRKNKDDMNRFFLPPENQFMLFFEYPNKEGWYNFGTPRQTVTFDFEGEELVGVYTVGPESSVDITSDGKVYGGPRDPRNEYKFGEGGMKKLLGLMRTNLEVNKEALFDTPSVEQMPEWRKIFYSTAGEKTRAVLIEESRGGIEQNNDNTARKLSDAFGIVPVKERSDFALSLWRDNKEEILAFLEKISIAGEKRTLVAPQCLIQHLAAVQINLEEPDTKVLAKADEIGTCSSLRDLGIETKRYLQIAANSPDGKGMPPIYIDFITRFTDDEIFKQRNEYLQRTRGLRILTGDESREIITGKRNERQHYFICEIDGVDKLCFKPNFEDVETTKEILVTVMADDDTAQTRKKVSLEHIKFSLVFEKKEVDSLPITHDYMMQRIRSVSTDDSFREIYLKYIETFGRESSSESDEFVLLALERSKFLLDQSYKDLSGKNGLEKIEKGYDEALKLLKTRHDLLQLDPHIGNSVRDGFVYMVNDLVESKTLDPEGFKFKVERVKGFLEKVNQAMNHDDIYKGDIAFASHLSLEGITHIMVNLKEKLETDPSMSDDNKKQLKTLLTQFADTALELLPNGSRAYSTKREVRSRTIASIRAVRELIYQD